MKLITDPRSLHSVKVLCVLHHESIPFDLQSIDLVRGDHRTEAFQALNPNQRVPVLQDGDFVLWESNAILLYVAEKHRSELLPTDLQGRAEINRWLAWQAHHWGAALSGLTFQRIAPGFFPGFQADPREVERHEADLARLAPILDAHLKGRTWVLDKLSLADFALAAYTWERREARLDLSPYRHISGWLERMEALPAWQRTSEVKQPA